MALRNSETFVKSDGPKRGTTLWIRKTFLCPGELDSLSPIAAVGASMGTLNQSIAESLASMPDAKVKLFLQKSVRDRNLSQTVRQLNRQLMSGESRDAEMADKALRKLGFGDFM